MPTCSLILVIDIDFKRLSMAPETVLIKLEALCIVIRCILNVSNLIIIFFTCEIRCLTSVNTTVLLQSTSIIKYGRFGRV